MFPLLNCWSFTIVPRCYMCSHLKWLEVIPFKCSQFSRGPCKSEIPDECILIKAWVYKLFMKSSPSKFCSYIKHLDNCELFHGAIWHAVRILLLSVLNVILSCWYMKLSFSIFDTFFVMILSFKLIKLRVWYNSFYLINITYFDM